MGFVVGVDFGTDSVRALIVDALTGETAGESVAPYPRWAKEMYCDASAQVFRQHPNDYLEAMTRAVRGALDGLSPAELARVAGIGFDATGSTVCPVDAKGVPLSLLPEFAENPDAMFHLWKDHSALREAADINRVFRLYAPWDYTRYQGEYSAEWFWAKILHAIRRDEGVRNVAYSWVELTDWVPAMLAGNTKPETMYRCASSAGHKALWHSALGGLPSGECLREIHPYLERVARRYARPGFSTQNVGMLTEEWKRRFGLRGDAVVGGSSLDAHAGAVGAGIAPGILVKVVGTSSVDLAVIREADMSPDNHSNLFGTAQDAVLPGYLGLESGQCAFGDVFAWLRSLLAWVLEDTTVPPGLRDTLGEGLLSRLEAQAGEDPAPGGLAAVDWLNGRRYPDVDYSVRAAILGVSLGTRAPDVYRALALAAVFGSRVTLEGITRAGVPVREVVAVGGIAHKSPYIMQTLADALNRRISVCASKQACALGAAMYAAVAAGIHPDLPAAQQAMGAGFSRVYTPDPDRTARLKPLYEDYVRAGDAAKGWKG